MMSPVVLISVLAQALTTSAGDRSEIRLRGGQGGTSVDLATTGQFALRLAGTRANWGLSYAPNLTLFNFGESRQTTVLQHAGTMQASFTLTPRLYVYVSESATYGERYMQLMAVATQSPTSTPATSESTTSTTEATAPSSSAGAGSGTSAQSGSTAAPTASSTTLVVPRLTKIRYASTNTDAGITYRLSPRWRALARVGYGVSGGLDERSRQNIPRMMNALTGVLLAHSVSRSDQVALNVEATSTNTELTQVERQAYIISSTAEWTRSFTPRIDAGVSAGVSYTWLSTTVLAVTPVPPFPVSREETYAASALRGSGDIAAVYPVAAANARLVQPLREGRLTVTALEQIYPFVDRMTGTIKPRSATTASATWTKGRIQAVVGMEATTTLTNVAESNTLRRSFSLIQGVSYRMRRHWQFEVGARQMWMSFANVNTPMMWTGFIAATYTTSNRSM